MRKLAIVFCLLILPSWSMAQWTGNKTKDNISIGIKGGINFPGMRYTDPHQSVLPQDTLIKPLGGVFVDIPINQFLTIAPEVMYVGRGMRTHYKHYSNNTIIYGIQANYVDLRIPVMLGIEVTSWFQPYLVVGPDAGYCLGGKIQIDQAGMPNPEISVPLGKANITPWYLGTFGGLGLRFFPTINEKRAQIKLDAVYNYSFMDSFSPMEHNETSQAQNVNAYNLTGERFPRGIEVTLGVVIPLIREKDACYGFSRNYY